MSTREPGWLPDPTGRHEHRYWDGNGWTDQVADGGITSADALPAADVSPAAAAGPVMVPGGPSTGLLVGLGLLVVGLVVAIGVVLVTGDGSSETNTISTDDETTTTTTPTTEVEPTSTTTTEPEDLTEVSEEEEMLGYIAEGILLELGDLLSEDEALCMAGAMVDAVGLESLITMGLEIEYGGVDPEDIFAQLTSEEAGAMGAGMAGCVDDAATFMHASLKEEFLVDAGHIVDEVEAECMADVFLVTFDADELMQVAFTDQDPFEELTYQEQDAFTAGMVDCIGAEKMGRLALEAY